MEGNGKTVFRVILRLMGEKLSERTRDTLELLLEGNGDLERVIDLMKYNCEFETAAEIALLVAILNPWGAKEWIGLLANQFELDRPEKGRSEGDYRFTYGAILAIFKIANELPAMYPEINQAREVLTLMPSLIHGLITNHKYLIEKANKVIYFPDADKTINKFRSMLATEISRYIRCDATKKDCSLRADEVHWIFHGLLEDKDSWQDNKIGKLILEQICYALFGSFEISERLKVLDLFWHVKENPKE
jgi:hypothetical protein